jgi:fumarate hydratase subunit beta
MKPKNLTTPLTKDKTRSLKAGDQILLSGIIYTARDAAHKRLCGLLKDGCRLPLDFKDAVIYYAGPTPAGPDKIIGSCGPTTSSRMDEFTPALMRIGLSGMIGKGDRSIMVQNAIKKTGCVYLIAIGGIGALLSTKVKSAKAVLFKELGPEAVYKLEVEDFPLIVGIDAKGNNLYDKTKWKRSRRAS